MGEKHLTPPIDLTCSNIDGKRKEKEGAAFAQCGGSYCKKKKSGKNIATFVLLQNQNTLALKNLWER